MFLAAPISLGSLAYMSRFREPGLATVTCNLRGHTGCGETARQIELCVCLASDMSTVVKPRAYVHMACRHVMQLVYM